MRQIILLAHAIDASAAALHAALLAQHPHASVRWVDAAALTLANWSWLLPGVGDGMVHAALRLPDGSVLQPGPGDIVVNRCASPDPPAFAAASAADRDYARQEASAILHAWLDSLPALVLNPPGAGMGAWARQGPLPWLALAHHAGLPTRDAIAACPGRQAGRLDGWQAFPIAAESWTSALPGVAIGVLPGSLPQLLLEPLMPPFRRVIVCTGAVHGGPLAAGCLRLAANAGTPLLAIEFGTAADGTERMMQADPLPDLTPADAMFVAAQLAPLSVTA
jgi:hypothetical protein